MILSHSITIPIVAPTTTTAIGAKYAICAIEYLVTAAPPSQMAMTTKTMIATSRLSFTRLRLAFGCVRR